MSSSFWSGEFYFDGIYSDTLNVCIIDFNTNEKIKQVGINTTIDLSEENSFSGRKSYIETNRNSDNITLQLCKTDGNSWDEATIIGVYNWLFKKDFKKFQTMDYSSGYNLCYYLKAVSFKKFLDPYFNGYLEIEFMSYSPYCYSIPVTNPVVTNGNSTIITNYSNLYEPYKPKVKITNMGNTTTNIRIVNNTNSSFIEVLGLNTNEVITIDCAMGTVINSSGINRFTVLQDYNLLSLQNGENSVTLTGNAKAEFICEFPVII